MLVNELIIIQSLPAGETQTGDVLRKSLAATDPLPIPVHVINVVNRASLFGALEELLVLARDRGGAWVPIIHFEVHGDTDKQGFVLASGELARWRDVANILREINISVRNALVVVLGVCSGALILTAAVTSPFEPAPFRGVIGPDRPVGSFFLPVGFRAFYTELLTSGDFAVAVRKLRQHTLPEYAGYDTATMFRIGLQTYVREHLIGVKLARRVKRILRKMPRTEIDKLGSRNKARLVLAERLKATPERLRRDYEHFTMIDRFPELAKEFPPSDAPSAHAVE